MVCSPVDLFQRPSSFLIRGLLTRRQPIQRKPIHLPGQVHDEEQDEKESDASQEERVVLKLKCDKQKAIQQHQHAGDDYRYTIARRNPSRVCSYECDDRGAGNYVCRVEREVFRYREEKDIEGDEPEPDQGVLNRMEDNFRNDLGQEKRDERQGNKQDRVLDGTT